MTSDISLSTSNLGELQRRVEAQAEAAVDATLRANRARAAADSFPSSANVRELRLADRGLVDATCLLVAAVADRMVAVHDAVLAVDSTAGRA